MRPSKCLEFVWREPLCLKNLFSYNKFVLRNRIHSS
jgi:hypothetical protein